MNTENNKIIAEFMGMKPINKNESNGIWNCTIKANGIWNCTIKAHGFNIVQHLSFHSDWNWLMEVVEKIESLGYISNQDSRICEGSLKPIYYFRIFIKHYRGQNVGYSKSNSRIEAVYNACLEFIKWYNEQKKV